MIVLDTTVLMYAVGGDHPLREPCGWIVRAIADGKLQAGTTVEVIQEFAHVRARRRGRTDASVLAFEFASLLQPLVLVDESDLQRGIQLYRELDEVGPFDAVLAAVAIRRGLPLVSADSGFASVPGLRWLHPRDDAATILN